MHSTIEFASMICCWQMQKPIQFMQSKSNADLVFLHSSINLFKLLMHNKRKERKKHRSSKPSSKIDKTHFRFDRFEMKIDREMLIGAEEKSSSLFSSIIFFIPAFVFHECQMLIIFSRLFSSGNMSNLIVKINFKLVTTATTSIIYLSFSL